MGVRDDLTLILTLTLTLGTRQIECQATNPKPTPHTLIVQGIQNKTVKRGSFSDNTTKWVAYTETRNPFVDPLFKQRYPDGGQAPPGISENAENILFSQKLKTLCLGPFCLSFIGLSIGTHTRNKCPLSGHDFLQSGSKKNAHVRQCSHKGEHKGTFQWPLFIYHDVIPDFKLLSFNLYSI